MESCKLLLFLITFLFCFVILTSEARDINDDIKSSIVKSFSGKDFPKLSEDQKIALKQKFQGELNEDRNKGFEFAPVKFEIGPTNEDYRKIKICNMEYFFEGPLVNFVKLSLNTRKAIDEKKNSKLELPKILETILSNLEKTNSSKELAEWFGMTPRKIAEYFFFLNIENSTFMSGALHIAIESTVVTVVTEVGKKVVAKNLEKSLKKVVEEYLLSPTIGFVYFISRILNFIYHKTDFELEKQKKKNIDELFISFKKNILVDPRKFKHCNVFITALDERDHIKMNPFAVLYENHGGWSGFDYYPDLPNAPNCENYQRQFDELQKIFKEINDFETLDYASLEKKLWKIAQGEQNNSFLSKLIKFILGR